MNTEKIIAEIEWLEHLFSLPDNSDWRACQRQLAAIRRLEKLYRLPDERPVQLRAQNGGTAETVRTDACAQWFQTWRRGAA